jgi:hypothetical protein
MSSCNPETYKENVIKKHNTTTVIGIDNIEYKDIIVSYYFTNSDMCLLYGKSLPEKYGNNKWFVDRETHTQYIPDWNNSKTKSGFGVHVTPRYGFNLGEGTYGYQTEPYVGF